MSEKKDRSGIFTKVTLNPEVRVAGKHMIEIAIHLQEYANKKRFIAASVNFPIYHTPTDATDHGIQ